MLFAALYQPIFALGIDAQFSYMGDFVPVRIMDTDLGLQQPIGTSAVLKGRIQYLDFYQPALQGVKPLQCQIVSGLGGISWAGLRGLAGFDALGGADIVLDMETHPRGYFEACLAAPVAPNRYVNQIQLKPMLWYTNRIVNAAAVRNRIASWGFSSELSAALGTAGGIAVNYRREHLVPPDSMLDSSLFEDRYYGFVNPQDTFQVNKPNVIQSFGWYIYYGVLRSLYLGYAFSSRDSRHDRFMLTGETDDATRMMPAGQVARVMKYSYYPYMTPQDEIAHLLTIGVPVSFGQRLRFDGKTAVPLYSRQTMTYYRDTIRGYITDSYLNGNSTYVLKNTFPITCEGKITIVGPALMQLSIGYSYFAFPYNPWGYFTSERYYIHTAKMQLQHQF